MQKKIAGAALCMAAIVGVTTWGTPSSAKSNPSVAPAAKAQGLPCDDVKAPRAKKAVREHDDSIRASAQKGLNFLTEATIDWQKQNNCMGCHVQGVTGEALAVGMHHQYEVAPKEVDEVFRGLLDLSGGVRTEDGHAAQGSTLRASTRAFAGASLARYDLWVSEKYGDDLINAATDLLSHQSEEGDIAQAYNHGIAKGPLQGTYQAIQTWQQAYARTADDRWLTAIGKGEAYIQKQIDAWYGSPTGDVQHFNYALLGLLAAGVGSTEKVATDLRDKLLAAQNEDGGFPAWFGGESTALTTGQTLYTLRRLGMNDADAAVKKATMFLIEAQQPDGGWSDSGGEKAEAMWAVLGLVSTDVLSVNVAGLKNGQHVDGKVTVRATATDNEGSGVKKIEIAVDDEFVGGACSDSAAHTFDASKLSTGMHTIDITAFNAEGKEARRRLVVYAGDHYITSVGTKYSDGGTLLSLRDIAPVGTKHTVELAILKDGKTIHTMKQAGEQGPLAFHWKGEMKGDARAKHGDYVARLSFRDAEGKIRQTQELPFVHDTPENQAQNYAQVAGRIQFAEDDADVQNATIELVDEEGNVVQSTRSTASGSYRFRNVKSAKKYKVRVKKNGRADKEVDLAPAAPAAEQAADFKL